VGAKGFFGRTVPPPPPPPPPPGGWRAVIHLMCGPEVSVVVLSRWSSGPGFQDWASQSRCLPLSGQATLGSFSSSEMTDLPPRCFSKVSSRSRPVLPILVFRPSPSLTFKPSLRPQGPLLFRPQIGVRGSHSLRVLSSRGLPSRPAFGHFLEEQGAP